MGVVNRKVQELEAEVQQLRASSGVMSMFSMPSREDVLSGGYLLDWLLPRGLDVHTWVLSEPRAPV
jgi:hypothetical protein